MADGLRRLVQEDTLRKELSRKGLARAAEFTWEKAARRMWAVYRAAAAS